MTLAIILIATVLFIAVLCVGLAMLLKFEEEPAEKKEEETVRVKKSEETTPAAEPLKPAAPTPKTVPEVPAEVEQSI